MSSDSRLQFDYSVPSTVIVTVPAEDNVVSCFHTVDHIRKHLQRSKRDLKLCIFRSLPGLPFISTHEATSTNASPSKYPVEDIARWDRLLQHFRRFAFVTVAVLDGAADDIALSFALACDFVVGTPTASYASLGAERLTNASQGVAAPAAAKLPFWSLASLGMHVGIMNAQRFIVNGGMSHEQLAASGILLQVVADSSIESLANVAIALQKELPNRRGRTHMQTRNGLVSSYAIKGAEHIGHCLAVLNVNIDAALESDPEIVFAPPLPGTEGLVIAVEEVGSAKQLVVSVPPTVALESLGTAMLFGLLSRVKAAAAEGACTRVLFRFELPEATAGSKRRDSPNKLVFSAEVHTLMEKESSGKSDTAVAGASASSTYKDMRDLQIISVKALTRWEKFLHSVRALPFITVAQFAGDGVASAATVQFASMCDLWVADLDADQQFTFCQGGSGQLCPGSLLFRVAKSVGLARARALMFLNDPARVTAILRDHYTVPSERQARLFATPGVKPHPGFLPAFRRLLQEACHEELGAFVHRHAKERQKVLGVQDVVIPERFTSFHDIVDSLCAATSTTPLVQAALSAETLPSEDTITTADFAETVTVHVTSQNVLNIRFKPTEADGGVSLSTQTFAELIAIFDFFERGATPVSIVAVNIILPEGGFTNDNSATVAGPESENDRVLLGHLQLLMTSVSVPTYACVSGTIRGDALEIALASDYRIATQETSFAAPIGGTAFRLPGALFIRLARSIGNARLNRLLHCAATSAEDDGSDVLSFSNLVQNGIVSPSALALLGSSVEVVDRKVARHGHGTDSTPSSVTVAACARSFEMRCRRMITLVPQLSCRQTALQLEQFHASTSAHPAALAAAGGARAVAAVTSSPVQSSVGPQVHQQQRLALQFDDETNIPVIVLDRAANGNRIDTLMISMLSQVVSHLEERGYESVVLRSQDPKVFCAGIDDKDIGFDPAESVANLNAVFNLLDEASFVSIALVQGDCHGAGFELAMSCDVRVAGPDANFWYPSKDNTKHAVSNMRPRLAGVLSEDDVLTVLDGKKLSATAAHDIGIVSYVSTEPYSKVIQFAQSFMQQAIQSPADETKGFSAGDASSVETKVDVKAIQATSDVVTSTSSDLPTYNASLLSIATAVPPNCLYTQAEIAEMMQITDPTLKKLFGASHIRSRNLAGLKEEQQMDRSKITQGYLLSKHLKYAQMLSKMTIPIACERAGISLKDVEYIVVTSSTGFVLPPLTAQVSELLGLRPSIQRTDIVGMGCHAGLNGMRSAANWVTQRANHGKYAVLACIEVCSAEYVWDPKTMQSRSCLGIAVTNSLFGDGASACVLTCNPPNPHAGQELASPSPLPTVQRHPKLLGFESYLIPNSLRSMFMDWLDETEKYSFLVMPEAPYLIGLCIPRMINKLLERFDLPIEDVSHWIVHSGGKKVIDQIVYTLGITADDVYVAICVLSWPA